MSSRIIAFSALFALTASFALAQTAALSYRPVDAQYDAQLDRMILISSNPNRLHIYDPVTTNDVAIGLVQPPLSLSVTPDGSYAAVGHDAYVSYVNLRTGSVEKVYPVGTTVNSLVAAGAWIYVMPSYDGGPISLNVLTGSATTGSFVYGSYGWYNSAVNAIYGTRDGISPNDVEEYDISTGPITRQFDSPYHGDFCIYGPVWFSPDGARIYTGCGTVFRASTDSKVDMTYLSSIKNVTAIGALAESATLSRVALVTGNSRAYPQPDVSTDNIVQFFDSAYLQPLGQLKLTDFSANGKTFAGYGRKLFFNSASSELIVLKEADQTSGLLNDYAVQRIPLSTTASCGATFAASSANVPGNEFTGSVRISAPAQCAYQAKTLSPWITLLSGAYAVGDGTLQWAVSPNPDLVDRSGVITLGSQSFVVRQDPGSASSASLYSTGYNAVDATYSKATDKLILVSANPNELHVYDPAAQRDSTVPLGLAPLSVSVRPDGLYAAVGHDGWVSVVDLTRGTVQNVIAVPTDVHSVIYAANGYLYLFPSRDWSDIYSLDLTSGTITATSAIYQGREPRLYANGKILYVGGNWQSKWDISQGVAKTLTQSLSGGCGKNWLTEDGKRLIGSCGKVYLTSEVASQDMQYNGTLSNTTNVAWADESASAQVTAAIPAGNQYQSTGGVSPDDTVVQLYTDAFLGYQGAIALPSFQSGTSSFASHGRYIFWNKTGDALYAVVQADAKASLVGGTGVVRLAAGSAKQLSISSIVNSASQVSGRISPGELITLYGTSLGPASGASFSINSAGKIDTSLAGTQVFFNGVAAPVLYASDTQVNVVTPFESSSSGQTNVQVKYAGITSLATTATLAPAIPGIFAFAGRSQAVATNLDGTVCDALHPATRGSYIIVYFTGGGGTSPSASTGSLAGLTLKKLVLTASATVGDVPATVAFAGAAPTLVEGVGQLNLKLDSSTPTGSAVPIVLTVGSNSTTATATIAVK